MKIRMIAQVSGTRDGKAWPAPGSVMDLPDDEARSYLDSQMAVAVAVHPAPSERAVVDVPEELRLDAPQTTRPTSPPVKGPHKR